MLNCVKDLDALTSTLEDAKACSFEYKDLAINSPSYHKYIKTIDKAIEQTKREKQDTLDSINSVENRQLNTLLRLRYIQGYTWERIADEMYFSYKHIMRLHKKALKAIEEK